MKLFFTILFASMIVMGCGTLSKVVGDNQPDYEFATQAILLSYIEREDAGPDRLATAARILKSAEGVRSYLGSSEQITVDELVSYVNSNVEWDKLEASQKLLAGRVIQVLADGLRKRIDGGELHTDIVVARDLVDVVIDTVNTYYL